MQAGKAAQLLKSGEVLEDGFFRSVVQAAVSPMFVLDADHRVVIWNRACEHLTGISADKIIGTNGHWRAFYDEERPTLADFIISGDFGSVEQHYKAYVASDASISSEGFFPNLGGKPCYLLFDASPIFNDKGDVIAAVETFRDITPRKITETALQASTDRFNKVLDSLDTIVYVSDMRTYELLYLNRYAQELFGETEGKRCFEAIQHGNDGPCEFCTNDRLVDSDGNPIGVYVWEFQNTKNGRWYYIHDQAIKWVDGRIVRLEVATDISERKKAEEELEKHRLRLSELVLERTAELSNVNETLQAEVTRHRRTAKVLKESEERFRNIFAESPVGIEIYDAKGHLFDANRACLEIFGVNDVQNIKSFSLFHDPNISEDIKERVRRGEVVRFEAVFDFERVRELNLYQTRKAGAIYLDVLISPLGFVGGGEVTGYLVQIQDVTEQKHLEEQLRHAQKMEAVGQLAGGIAHDFNNIISAISNFAYLLSIKMPKGDSLQEYVNRIMSSSERAAHLTHSLLAFSRKQVMNPRPVELNEIVLNIEKLLRRLIGEDVEIRVYCFAEELPIMADSHQIEQILMNLCTNARDAMPEGGSLNIITGNEDFVPPSGKSKCRYATLNISDSGRGMDENTRANIFEPFFTTKDPGKGTGLGLSIVYNIVNEHGGFIEVFSSPRKGTTFKIYFPLLEKQVEHKNKEDYPVPRGRGETVLLAEDDEDVRAVMSDILTGSGYQVIEAEDGVDAVKKFSERQENGGVDILIFDVLMPRMNGREAYHEIQSIEPKAKVLFLSGYTADVLQRRLVLEKGYTLLSKPFSPDKVLRKIRDMIDE